MAAKTDICNMALSRCGISKMIGNIETEKSNEALQCKLWYDQCRREILQARDWNIARERIALALTSGTPPTNWTYEYTYPNRCVAVRGLVVPGLPWPRKEMRSPFEIGNNGSQVVLWTDLAEAECVFTFDLEDTTVFQPFFISALAYLIASEISIPLTTKPDLSEQARKAYAYMLRQAAIEDAKEGETGAEPETEYLSARNG